MEHLQKSFATFIMSNNLMVKHFHFFEHFISFKSLLKLSSRDTERYRKMVDTVNITRQIERNVHLGISDFYLVEDKDGKLDFAGTMDLKRVLEIVKEKVTEQKSCDVSTLIPSKPLPQLPDRDLTNYIEWWNSIIRWNSILWWNSIK